MKHYLRNLMTVVLSAAMIATSFVPAVPAFAAEDDEFETEYETASVSDASSGSGSSVSMDDEAEEIVEEEIVEENEEITTLSVDADDVWSIGDDGYETLEDAVKAADNGDAIELLCNAGLESRVTIDGKEIIIDLGGNTLTGFFTVKGGANVTIENGTLEETGGYTWVYASGDDANPTEFTLASDATITSAYYGLCICGVTGSKDYDGTGFIVTVDGTIEMTESASAGIWVQGNMRTTSAEICEVVINGYVIAGNEGVGIACNGWANVEVNDDAYVEGGTGIEIRSGSLTVNGGTIVATNDSYACVPNSSGSTTDGAGIAIATHTTDNPVTVTINGGEISGVYAIAESNPQNVDNNNVTIEISDGTFIGSDDECAILISDFGDIDCEIVGGDFLNIDGEKSDISRYLSSEVTQDEDGNVISAPCEHKYDASDVTFAWSDDYESCTAIFTCTICGEEKEVACEVASASVAEPTCTEPGSADYTAAAEIESYPYDGSDTAKAEWTIEGVEIAALGHDWGEWTVTKEATETEDGEQERVCARCGEVETETIPATGENPNTETEPGIVIPDTMEAIIKITDKNGSYASGVVFNLYDEDGSLIGTLAQGSEDIAAELPAGVYTIVITDANGYTFAESEYTFEVAEDMEPVEIAASNVKSAGSGTTHHGGSSGSRSSSGSSSSSNSSANAWTYYSGIDRWTLNNFAYKSQWVHAYNPYATTEQGQYDWFHFDVDGYMDTGWFTDVDGHIYYLNPYADNTRGAMVTGWQTIDGQMYYFNEVSDGTLGALVM